ncbi:thioredoxin [Bacteroides sedimenti]|uniref:Thioredoxin n=1 Tax=Bacteroides sedimenti TaxID=2136147 RepID=A0ABM8IA57_9BACE
MEKFVDVIQSNSPVLVDFFAEWCGPCKIMKPILEDLKKQIGDSARIIKIDVDQYEELAAKYQIQSVPTLMIFKDGAPKWRQSGVMQASDLKEIIEKYK